MNRLLLLTGLVLLSAPFSLLAQTGGVARVVVKLPRDARLHVDEVFCPLPGTIRTFDTPPLDVERKYAYTLTVEINVDGKPVRVKRQIIVRANRTTEADFGDRTAIIAAAKGEEKKNETSPPPDLPPPEEARLPSKAAAPGQLTSLTKDVRRPVGSPPDLAEARLIDGILVVERRTIVFKTVEVIVEQPGPDGKPMKVRRKQTVSESVMQQVKIDPAKALLSTVEGKDVSPDALKSFLAEPAVIVLSNDFQPVDKFYLQLYDANTLVVVPPEPEQLPVLRPPG